MNVAARTETFEQRSAIYASLTVRNRIIGLLRVGLPAIGAIIFLGLILQLYLGTFVPDFGFARMSIDRDNLVFETPSYAGTGGDGTAYALSASSARASLSNTDIIHLNDAALTMEQPGGQEFSAIAEAARFSISGQQMTVDGTTTITSNSGLTGTLEDATINVVKESLDAPGGAVIDLGDGTRLESTGMSYKGEDRLWTFTGVRLVFDDTPGAGTYAPEGTSP